MKEKIIFRSVGIVAKVEDEGTIATTKHLLEYLKPFGLSLVVELATARELGLSNEVKVCSLSDMAQDIELAIVVGGDGSLLGVARAVATKNIPVVGINRGGLGFLAEIHPHALEAEIDKVLHGLYKEGSRFLLSSSVIRDNQQINASLALNDVVVHAGTMSRMMWFHLAIDDKPVYFQRSDGLIISSPTGSTAYSLSAGGPIMHPSLDALAIVPMFPHDLTSRPIVVRGASEIRVTVAESNALEPQVSCDSQVDFTLKPKDQVIVSKGPSLRLLHSAEHSFYETCRSKLDWVSRTGLK